MEATVVIELPLCLMRAASAQAHLRDLQSRLPAPPRLSGLEGQVGRFRDDAGAGQLP
jgi:hypothetical protein